jgi:putative endonuclease
MTPYYMYILTNYTRTVLYTGVTNNLIRRMYEHRNHLVTGFTDQYQVTHLVYFEETNDIREAIAREKQIKGWLRSRKVDLIQSVNPEWRDLADDWF